MVWLLNVAKMDLDELGVEAEPLFYSFPYQNVGIPSFEDIESPLATLCNYSPPFSPPTPPRSSWFCVSSQSIELVSLTSQPSIESDLVFQLQNSSQSIILSTAALQDNPELSIVFLDDPLSSAG